MSDGSGGGNVGVIVDDVHSVIQVTNGDVEQMGDGISSDIGGYVKGIIKIGNDEDEMRKDLVIWIDMTKLMKDMVNQQQIG